MLHNGMIYILRVFTILVLSFLLTFTPVIGGVAPVFAEGVAGGESPGAGLPSLGSALSGTASQFGSMYAAGSARSVTPESFTEDLYEFAGEALQDEEISDALVQVMSNVSLQEDSTLDDIVLQILRDDDLGKMLGDVIASYLLLEEGSYEREFLNQITADFFYLLDNDEDGSFKAYARDALSTFISDDRITVMLEDVLGMLVDYAGNVFGSMSEGGSFSEIPGLIDDFLKYMGETVFEEPANQVMTEVVDGLVDNVEKIPEEFREALEEDPDYQQATENLREVFWDALLDPMFGDLGEAGVLDDYLGKLITPECSLCPADEPQPGCSECGGGLWGAFGGMMEMWMMGEEEWEECFLCNDTDPNCPFCAIKGEMGSVMDSMMEDVDAVIDHYAEGATGGGNGGGGCEVEGAMGDYLMHWAMEILFEMFAIEEFSEELMDPLMGYFTEGVGADHIENIMDGLMANVERAWEMLSDEEDSPLADSIRENIQEPLDDIMSDLVSELLPIAMDIAGEISSDADVETMAEDFSYELNVILYDIFGDEYYDDPDAPPDEGEEIELEQSSDFIDWVFEGIDGALSSAVTSQVDALTGLEIDADSFESLAADIAAYMAEESESGSGLINAQVAGYEIAENLLHGLADSIEAEEEEPVCVDECNLNLEIINWDNIPGEEELKNLCDVCRDEVRDYLREGYDSPQRMENFYNALQGSGAFGEVFEEAPGMAEIVWTVIGEIIDEDFEDFFTDLRGDEEDDDDLGYIGELLRPEEEGLGVYDYGERIGSAAVGFLDRVFAPFLKLVSPRRFIDNYGNTEQERLEKMLSRDRIAGSLRWVRSPVDSFFSEDESKLVNFDGEVTNFADYVIDSFLEHGEGEETGLGIIATPQRFTALYDFAGAVDPDGQEVKEDLKEVEAGFFEDDTQDILGLVRQVVDRMDPELEPDPITLDDLDPGDRVVDPSWEWEHRTGNNYSGEGETKPVTWIVVDDRHYTGLGSHVTLIAEEVVGKYAFDDSTDRGSSSGDNRWGDSGEPDADHGVRPFLNDVFYDGMGDNFKNAILVTSLPNMGWEGDSYVTTDRIFLPSQTELGGGDSGTHEVGSDWGYFTDDASRVAELDGSSVIYWTRSPIDDGAEFVREVNSGGGMIGWGSADNNTYGVRPALNMSADVFVSAMPNGEGVHEIQYFDPIDTAGGINELLDYLVDGWVDEESDDIVIPFDRWTGGTVDTADGLERIGNILGEMDDAETAVDVTNIPARLLGLMGEEDAREILAGFMEVPVDPLIDATGEVLQSDNVQDVLRNLINDLVDMAINGGGNVMADIVANEQGELDFIEDMAVELFTFGDVLDNVELLLKDFLEDDDWLGWVDLDYRYVPGAEECESGGCPTPCVHTPAGLADGNGNYNTSYQIGTSGSGLEYILYSSVFYAGRHNTNFGHFTGFFWEGSYTYEDICDLTFYRGEMEQGARMGLNKFIEVLMEWLRGEGDFDGDDDSDPLVLQRPSNFLPNYLTNWIRYSVAGDFVPVLANVAVHVLNESLQYEGLDDIVAGWLESMLFLDENDTGLLGRIGETMLKEYDPDALENFSLPEAYQGVNEEDYEPNFAGLLKDVLVGFPDAEGNRELDMLDALAEQLMYDGDLSEAPDHPPVWLMQEHIAVTFSRLFEELGGFLTDRWSVSDILGDGMDTGQDLLEFELGLPVMPGTVEVFAPGETGDGWTRRQEITINNWRIHDDLDNFPVLVNLDKSNFKFGHARSDGHDIRFRMNGTDLDYERVRHDASEREAEYWVKLPSVSASEDTVFHIYYGNPAASDGENASAVWSSSYRGVWHKNDYDASTIHDSTSNANHGSKTSANNPLETDGLIGRAQEYDGVDDKIEVGTTNRPSNSFVYEAWVKAEEEHEIDEEGTQYGGTSGQKYVFDPRNEGASDVGAGLSVGTNGISVYEHGSSYAPPMAVYEGDIGDYWNHIAVVYFQKTPFIFLNGELVRQGLGDADSPGSHPRDNILAPYEIGNSSFADSGFKGLIDEARIWVPDDINDADEIVSRIQATYEMGRDNLTFTGEEEIINKLIALDDGEGTFINPEAGNELVQNNPAHNSIDYDTGEINLSIRSTAVGDDNVMVEWMPSMIGGHEMVIDPEELRSAIMFEPHMNEMLFEELDGANFADNVEQVFINFLEAEEETVNEQDVSRAFKAGYLLEDIPSRFVEEILTKRDGGESSVLGEVSSDLVTGEITTDLKDYELGGRVIGMLERLVQSDTIFNVTADNVSRFFNDMYETFKRRMKSLGGLLLEGGSAPLITPAAGAYDYDEEIIRSIPAAGINTLAGLFSADEKPEQNNVTPQVEVSGGENTGMDIVDDLESALERMDTSLIDEVLAEILSEDSLKGDKGDIEPLLQILAGVTADDRLVDATGGVIADNLQDGRLAEDLALAFNTFIEFLNDEDLFDVVNPLLISVLEHEDTEGYVDNLIDGLIDIASVLLDDAVRFIALETWPEDPFYPEDQTAVNKIMAKAFVTAALEEFEGYPGFPGYQDQLYDMVMDNRFSDLLKFLGETTAEVGLETYIRFLEDDRFKIILYELVYEVLQYGFSGIEAILIDPDLTTAIVEEGISSGIAAAGGGQGYDYLRDAVVRMVDNLITEDELLSTYLQNTFYTIQGEAPTRAENGTSWAADKVGTFGSMAPEQNIVATLCEELAVIPPEMINEAFFQWLFWGTDGYPDDAPAGIDTIPEWGENAAETLNPDLTTAVGEAYRMTQEYLLWFWLGDSAVENNIWFAGGATGHDGYRDDVMDRILDDLYDYFFCADEGEYDDIVAAIRSNPLMDPANADYIPRELVNSYVDNLPLEAVGTFLDIPLFGYIIEQQFGSVPPGGWSTDVNIGAHGYDWGRDTEVYRSGGGSAVFEHTDYYLEDGELFTPQNFHSPVFPPPQWDTVRGPNDQTGGDLPGWVRDLENRSYSGDSSAAGVIGDDALGLEDAGYDGTNWRFHDFLYSPPFTYEEGTGTLTFHHRHGKTSNTLYRAAVGIVDSDGNRHEQHNYTGSIPSGWTQTTVTLPDSYAGEEIRVYFESDVQWYGEDTSGCTSTDSEVNTYEWLIDDVSVEGIGVRFPRFADARLISENFTVGDADDEYLLEFYESSRRRHSHYYHAVELRDVNTNNIVHSEELGRAPAEPDWRRQRIDLSDFEGDMLRAEFHYRGAGADTWYIDDVGVRRIDDYEDRSTTYRALETYGHMAVEEFPLEEIAEDFLDGSCGECARCLQDPCGGTMGNPVGDCPGCFDCAECEDPVTSGAIKEAFSGLTQDLLMLIAESDLYYVLVDILDDFPIENIIGITSVEEMCGECAGCTGMSPEVSPEDCDKYYGFLREVYDSAEDPELPPELDGLSRADYIGEALPSILLGLVTDIIDFDAEDERYTSFIGEVDPGRETTTDLIYQMIWEVINHEDIGDGSPGKILQNLLLDLMADEETKENLAELVESLLEDLGLLSISEKYELELKADPSEGGTVTVETGGSSYEEGETVNVTASANSDFQFVNWTVDGDEVSTEETFDYEMPGNNVTLKANFINTNNYTLTVEAGAGGSTQPHGTLNIDYADTQELEAIPDSGYGFVNWTVDDKVISSREELNYTMPAEDITITANFAVLYELTLEVTDPEFGTVKGEGMYPAGGDVQVSASPNEEYIFSNWTEGSEVISEKATFNYTMPAEDTTLTADFVHFVPDETLRDAIKYALIMPGRELVRADLERLYSLSATGRGITDLTGLEYATNLKHLNLYGNEIEFGEDENGNDIPKLEPLSGLSNLESLTLSYAGLEGGDISALSDLTGLKELDLAHNNISGGSALNAMEFMPELEYLNLSGNNITSVIKLAELTSLKWLDLSDTNVDGTSNSNKNALGDLVTLEWLDLSGQEFDNFSFLSDMVDMRHLVLSDTNISDISDLENMANLEYLDMSDTPIGDEECEDCEGEGEIEGEECTDCAGKGYLSGLGPLEQLTNLVTLKLENIKEECEDCEGEGEIEGEECNDCEGTGYLVDIDIDWSVFTELHTLDLSDNCISNLDDLTHPDWGLVDLENFRRLYISDNNITDISALSDISDLTRLDLSGNENISDLSVIGNMEDLQYLYLSGISDTGLDLSFLNGMTLKELDLSDNNISDISELSEVEFIQFRSIFRAILSLGSDFNLDDLGFGSEFFDNIDGGGYLDLSGNEIGKKLCGECEGEGEIEEEECNDCYGKGYINDISPLSGKKLQVLDLSGNELTSSELDLSGNELTSSDLADILDINFGGALGGGMLDISDNEINSLEAWYDHDVVTTHPFAPYMPYEEIRDLELLILPENFLEGIETFKNEWRVDPPQEGEEFEKHRDWSILNRVRGTGTYVTAEDDMQEPETSIVRTGTQKPRDEVPVTTVSGQPFDPQSENLNEAVVTAREKDSGKEYSTTARSDGTFRLRLPAGTYRLEITQEGYKPLEIEEIKVQRDKESVSGMEIEQILETMSIKLDIYNKDEEPLENVRIAVRQEGGDEYHLAGTESGHELPVSPGTYRIEITCDGYLPVTLEDVTVDERGNAEGIEPVFMEPLTLDGKVSDVTGNLLEDAEISALHHNLQDKATSITGEDGTFTLGNREELLTSGSYRLEIEKPGYLKAVQNIIIDQAGNIEGLEDITLELLGDVTGTGEVEIADAILVLRHIVGLTTLNEEEKARGQVNGDENLSISDVIRIMRHVVGLSSLE